MSAHDSMAAIRAAIRDFDFTNYGLDDVDPTSEYAEWVGDLASAIAGALSDDASQNETAPRPPLNGLVRQIRATANEELALPTTYGKRAVRDFARDLETWIPEDYEPTTGGAQ